MIYKYKIMIGADQKVVTVNADSPEKAKEKVQKYANKLNAQYKGKKLQRMGDSTHPLEYVKRISNMKFKDENELLDYVKKTYPNAFLDKDKEVVIYGGVNQTQGNIALKNGKPVIYMMDSCATDANHNVGSKFRNAYGAEITVVEPTKSGEVQYKIAAKKNGNPEVHKCSKETFEKILRDNGYRKVNDAYTYNKFANEKNTNFLKDAIAEMKRYERNWNFMSASEKRNIMPVGGIKALREQIKYAENRLNELKTKDSCKTEDEDISDLSKKKTYYLNGKPVRFIGYNSLAFNLDIKKKHPDYNYELFSINEHRTLFVPFSTLKKLKDKNGSSVFTKDASAYRVVQEAYNALNELGYNNSTGKYDKVVKAVKSIYGQTLLDAKDPRFKNMIKTEVLKQLKRRGYDSCKVKDAKTLNDYNTDQLREIAVALGGDRKKLYGTSKDSMIYHIYQLEKSSGKKWRSVVNDSYKVKDKKMTNDGKGLDVVNMSGWLFKDGDLIMQQKKYLDLLNKGEKEEGKKLAKEFIRNVNKCLDQAVEAKNYFTIREKIYIDFLKDVDGALKYYKVK